MSICLDPSSILYGHGTSGRGAVHSPPSGQIIGSDGVLIYLVERDPDRDWDGYDLRQIWSHDWEYRDHRVGSLAEPIAFYSTDPNVDTWEQARELACLHHPDQPAATWEDDREQWYEHGRLHSIHGPAWLHRDCHGHYIHYYYLNGKRVSRRNWMFQRTHYF